MLEEGCRGLEVSINLINSLKINHLFILLRKQPLFKGLIISLFSISLNQ